jgi:beta-xylosidase
VTSGAVPLPNLDRAVSAILRGKFATGLFDGAWFVNGTALPSVLDAPPRRALARTAAAGSVVLLQNTGGLLPLQLGPGGKYKSVAVVGPNAGCLSDPMSNACDAISAQLGGYTNGGSLVVTVAAAMNATAEQLGLEVTFARGCNIDDDNTSMISEAVGVVKAADVAIVVVGDSTDGYGKGSCAEGTCVFVGEVVGGGCGGGGGCGCGVRSLPSSYYWLPFAWWAHVSECRSTHPRLSPVTG